MIIIKKIKQINIAHWKTNKIISWECKGLAGHKTMTSESTIADSKALTKPRLISKHKLTKYMLMKEDSRIQALEGEAQMLIVDK